MFSTVMRTIFVYFFLVLGVRLSGKRQIGQMQMSEFVTALLLSELATQPIVDPNAPLLSSIVPITILLCIEIFIPFLTNKIPKFKKIIDGAPNIIINKGIIDQNEMSHLRLSIDELLSELRLKDVDNINNVEYAILEENGQLSVFLKSDYQTVTKSDLNIKKPTEGIAHPLVISGSFSQFNLKLTGKSEDWVNSRLKGGDIKDVLLFTVDDNDNINIIMKDK